MTYHSKFQVINFVIPKGANVGIQETYEFVGKAVVRRDWNGNPIEIVPRFGRKMQVTHSGSGNAIRFEPAFEAMKIGNIYTVNLIHNKSTQILAGQTSVALEYSPVANSIIVTDETTGLNLVGAYNGSTKTVSLAAAAVNNVSVKYRPSGQFFLLEYSGGANEIEGTQTFTVKWEQAT